MTIHKGTEALNVITNNASDYQDMEVDEQRSYNHSDCPSGADWRGRLSVKRVDGMYIWHCYNCGDSGYYVSNELQSMRRPEFKVKESSKKTTYEDLTKNTKYDTFRLEGQFWLAQYEFDDVLCRKYGIVEVDGGIVLPTYSNTGMSGYQVRQYSGNPKYLSFVSNGYSMIENITLLDEDCPIVLVEDLLSSYKLNEAGYPALCLLGTKLDAKALEVLQHYRHKRILVWLDDDKAGHKAALSLLRELSVTLPNITSMFNKQPKDFFINDLSIMEL